MQTRLLQPRSSVRLFHRACVGSFGSVRSCSCCLLQALVLTFVQVFPWCFLRLLVLLMLRMVVFVFSHARAIVRPFFFRTVRAEATVQCVPKLQ